MSHLAQRALLLTLALALPGCIFLSDQAPSPPSPDMTRDDATPDLPPEPDETPDLDEAPDESMPLCTDEQPVRCGQTCHNLQNDTLHCGECDRGCEGDAPCVNGMCPEDVPCGDGEDRCEGSSRCVPLNTNAHCGSCEISCGASEACVEGACQCTRPDAVGILLFDGLAPDALLRVVALPDATLVGQNPLQENYRVIALEPTRQRLRTVAVNALGKPVGDERSFTLTLPDQDDVEHQLLTTALTASEDGKLLLTLLTSTEEPNLPVALAKRHLSFFWLDEALNNNAATLTPVTYASEALNPYRARDIRGVQVVSQGPGSYAIATLERDIATGSTVISSKLILRKLQSEQLLPVSANLLSEEVTPISASLVPITMVKHATQPSHLLVGFQEQTSITALANFKVFKFGVDISSITLVWGEMFSGMPSPPQEIALAWWGADALIFGTDHMVGRAELLSFEQVATRSTLIPFAGRSARLMIQQISATEGLLEAAHLEGPMTSRRVAFATRELGTDVLGDESTTRSSALPGSGYVAIEGAVSERTRRASIYFTLEQGIGGPQNNRMLNLKAWPRVAGQAPCGELSMWRD